MEQNQGVDRAGGRLGRPTSIDKAFDVCEALSGEPDGLSVSELARLVRLPRPSVHRLLSVLRHRGYVRQDEETHRYGLSVKLLDLCFRQLGRSELRLHAYPVLREYAGQSGLQAFLAVPASGEVTTIWGRGDEVVARTAYGQPMPVHCVRLVDSGDGGERASCLRLAEPRDVLRAADLMRRVPGDAGPDDAEGARVTCTCAPVFDYSGREVARVGLVGEGIEARSMSGVHVQGAWELARHLSMRLGYLSAVAMGVAR